MFKIEEIKDGNIINQIIEETGSKQAILGDDDYRDPKILINDAATHYLFKKDDEIMGYCSFINPSNEFVWSDVVFYKKHRGKDAIKIGKSAMEKYFYEKWKGKPIKFIGKIHKNNRASLFYAIILGFKKIIEIENFNIVEVTYGWRN